jgi:hypothetical protein
MQQGKESSAVLKRRIGDSNPFACHFSWFFKTERAGFLRWKREKGKNGFMIANEIDVIQKKLDEFQTKCEFVFEWTTEPDQPCDTINWQDLREEIQAKTHEDEAEISREQLKNLFYKHAYVHIEGDHNNRVFDRFLRSSKNILILTGPVGIGKSTFLRYQLEYVQNCVGIVIDLNEKYFDFRNRNIEECLREKISEYFKEKILRNIHYFYVLNRQPTTDFIYEDLMWKGEKLPKIDRNDSLNNNNAKVDMAVHILVNSININSSKIEEIRAEFADDIGLGGNSALRKKFRKSVLKGNFMQNCEKIYGAMGIRDWMRLYQILFNPSVPIVIIIDNADALEPGSFHGNISSALFGIHGALNRDVLASISQRTRIIFAIRDENISLLNAKGHPATRIWQIAFGKDHYKVPNVTEKIILPISKKFASEIVKARLFFLERIQTVDEKMFIYFKKILDTWFKPALDHKDSVLSTEKTSINIVAMGNSSIRWILDDVRYTCFSILKSCCLRKIPLTRFANIKHKPWLSGRLVRSFWEMPGMDTLSKLLREDFRRKKISTHMS